MKTKQIEIKKISRKQISAAVTKLYKITKDFETVEKTRGWLHSCGNCTSCYTGKNWYEAMKRIGEHFAFALNSCYNERFVMWQEGKYGESGGVSLLYTFDRGQTWELTEEGERYKLREIVEFIHEAYAQALEYAKKETEKNKEAIEKLNKIFS